MPSADLKHVISRLVEPVVAAEGVELVDVELAGSRNRRTLRIFIDKPEGVTLDDCQNISVQVGALLDVDDPIDGSYTLEVSSPGLDRLLRTSRDFRRALGRLVRMELERPIEKRKGLKGRVTEVTEDAISLQTGAGELLSVPLDAVVWAKLEVEFCPPRLGGEES